MKRLSYIEEARCLKVNVCTLQPADTLPVRNVRSVLSGPFISVNTKSAAITSPPQSVPVPRYIKPVHTMWSSSVIFLLTALGLVQKQLIARLLSERVEKYGLLL